MLTNRTESAAAGDPRPRAFTPAEPGTPETRWLGDRRWDDVPAIRPADLDADRLVVLAAHPDDESLGVAATIADAAAAGMPIDVVLATDGTASHPRSPLWTPDRLGALREAELRQALGVVAPDASVRTLGLPDGTLADDPARLRRLLEQALAEHADRRTVLLAPYPADGHADHDTLGRAAGQIAAERGVRIWYYPIWLWHWADPDEFPWSRAVAVQASAAALHAKAAAIAAHRSQIAPLSPLPGDEALLPPHMLARFARVVETLIAPQQVPPGLGAAAEEERRRRRNARFEAMLGDGDDPWDSTSWYERRKHALTVALRTRERYGRAIEIGCSTGALTGLIARHAGHVTAVDGSAAALAVARRRRSAGVTWRHAEVPSGLTVLPDGYADLVVISEIAYFLTGAEFLALLRQARRLAAVDGEIVLVDWREGAADLPLDGELVHAQAVAAYADLTHRLSYRDESVRAEVWGGSPLRPGARP